MFIECKKVWKRKKILAILLGLLAFQVFFFVYSAEQEKSQREEWGNISYEEEYISGEEEYLSGFHDGIEAIVKQADAMGAISIFAQPDSFSTRNREQTKEDFAGLLEVEPVLVESPYLQAFFSDSLIHILAVLAGALIAFTLVDENKQGLRCMIFSTQKGRGRFAVYKMMALLVWTGIVAFIYYVGFFSAVSCYYSGNLLEDVNLPIQSLSMFGDFRWQMSIGVFLVGYLICRWLILFVVSLFIWLVLFCVNNLLFSVGIVGLTGLGSYLIYQLIGSSHPLNIVRYCNPWYFICGNEVFTEYRNLDLFSQAVNKDTVIVVWGILVMTLLFVLAVSAAAWRYPCVSSAGRGTRKIKAVIKRFKNWQGKWARNLGLTGMEYYKVLISQKGIIVILLIIGVFIYQADFEEILWSGSQTMYFEYVDKYEGVPNEESAEEIRQVELELEKVEQEYKEAAEKYENGEINFEEYFSISMYYDGFHKERNFLDEITIQTEYLENLKEEQDIDGWYINLYSYRKLLSEGNSLVNVLMVLGIVLICSGIFARENKCGMTSVLRCSVQGRGALFKRKMQVAMLLSFLLYGVLAVLEIATVNHVYGLSGWGAPVQSIMQLSFLPVRCSIGTFFVLLYSMKGIMVLAVAAFTCMISTRMDQKVTIGIAFSLCIPAFLTLAGIEIFKYLSVTELLLVAPFLLLTRNFTLMVVILAVFTAFGVISVRNGYKKWCVS